MCLLSLAGMCLAGGNYQTKEGRCDLARQLISGGLSTKREIGMWMCIIEVNIDSNSLDFSLIYFDFNFMNTRLRLVSRLNKLFILLDFFFI